VFAVVTLADGRKLKLDVVDVVVSDSNGAAITAAFTTPNGIIRAANCTDDDWLDFCREGGVISGTPVSVIR
jgi:hypothetical protein